MMVFLSAFTTLTKLVSTHRAQAQTVAVPDDREYVSHGVKHT